MTAIIEYVRYDIPVESREAFKSSYKVALPLLTGAPGCESWELRQGVENPSEFIARVLWTSIDHHIMFRESANFPVFKANFVGVEIVSIGHYEQVVL